MIDGSESQSSHVIENRNNLNFPRSASQLCLYMGASGHKDRLIPSFFFKTMQYQYNTGPFLLWRDIDITTMMPST